MKPASALIDGSKETWDYDKPIWTDYSKLNEDGVDADGETKTWAFNDLKSKSIRVRFERNGQKLKECYQEFDYQHNTAKTLREIFASGELIDKSPGSAGWKGLGCGEFQTTNNCNKHGFNINAGGKKVRYGMMFSKVPDSVKHLVD